MGETKERLVVREKIEHIEGYTIAKANCQRKDRSHRKVDVKARRQRKDRAHRRVETKAKTSRQRKDRAHRRVETRRRLVVRERIEQSEW
jgi:hypothetical protein